MSDRASNEKASDVILEQWHQDVLKSCDFLAAEKTLHSFHCMVHVLLGFHSNTKTVLFSYEKDLEIECGKFGRDALPQFFHWTKEEAAG